MKKIFNGFTFGIISIIIVIILAISNVIMISTGWYYIFLNVFELKSCYITEIDGKEYLAIRSRDSWDNLTTYTIVYYEDYNFIAYHKTEEYMKEIYEEDYYNQRDIIKYRTYYKVPNANSVTYYYDDKGNTTQVITE